VLKKIRKKEKKRRKKDSKKEEKRVESRGCVVGCITTTFSLHIQVGGNLNSSNFISFEYIKHLVCSTIASIE